ncbi:21784_t:CDS:1, partial [Gigaspora rosea]
SLLNGVVEWSRHRPNWSKIVESMLNRNWVLLIFLDHLAPYGKLKYLGLG